jgi:hypothetical protein
MKQSLVPGVVMVSLLLASTSLAAQQPVEEAHSLTEGAWALQFGISNNLSLVPFAGGVISAKHHRTDATALRYGLSLAAQHRAGRDERHDATVAMVGVSADFLQYPTLASDPDGNLQMFWGIGPLARFQRHRVNPTTGDVHTFTEWAVGAGGTIGAEWFVKSRISLSAEYRTTVVATFLSEPAPDAWGLSLGHEGVRFGVSVYFR